MKMKETMVAYEAPMVEVIEVEVEKGFATSATLNSASINDLNNVTWD